MYIYMTQMAHNQLKYMETAEAASYEVCILICNL